MEESVPASLFSEQQKVVLTVIPMAAAFVSTLASFLTVFTLLVDKVERSAGSFRRISLGACFMDIMYSGTMVLMGGWAVPNSPWTVSGWASGNLLTCNIMGFLSIFGTLGQTLYSASLAMYHLLVVRYRWRQTQVAVRVEPVLHIVPFLLALASATALLQTEYINSLHIEPGACGPSTNPPNCLHYPDLDCIRGHKWVLAHQVCTLAYGTVLLLAWAFMISANTLMWLSVRSTERRMQQYGLRSSRAANLISTKRVGVQGIMYVGCFTLAHGVTLFRSLILFPLFETGMKNRLLYFWIQLVAISLLQLQGFLHTIVYFRTRWKSLTQPGRIWGRVSSPRRDVCGADLNFADGDVHPRGKSEQENGVDQTDSSSTRTGTENRANEVEVSGGDSETP